MSTRPLETAKGLYRRMETLLTPHVRAGGRAAFDGALRALHAGFADELGIDGAWLLERTAAGLALRTRVAEGSARVPATLPAVPAGSGVHLLEPGARAPQPLGWFELAAESRTHVFLFAFRPEWQRDAAELVLNTASSVLLVKLTEERLGATMRDAAEIQTGLLPEGPPDFPGFDIAARSRPAEEVGGDWYDYLPLGPGSIGLAVGDASGHGLCAALAARDVVVGLRMAIERELRAGYALEKLNRVLHRSTLSSRFASLVYGELEETGSFFYYNAGHDAPLLVRDGRCESLRTGDTVLGPLSEARFRRHFAHLDRGDLLALHTDGLIERRSAAGELYGLERLRGALVTAGDAPAQAVVERVFSEVDRFGSDQGRDDETLVIVRRLREPRAPA